MFPPQKFVLPSVVIASCSSWKSASFVVASTDIIVVSTFVKILSSSAVLGFKQVDVQTDVTSAV